MSASTSDDFNPEDFQVPEYSVAPVLKSFVAEEVLPLFDFTEAGLKANFKNSKAAIYAGDEKEMLKWLHFFREFPGSFDVFKQTTHPYSIIPAMFKSMQNRQYIYKQDYLGYLHCHIPLSSMGPAVNSLMGELIGFFLRAKETKLEGLCELIPFDKEGHEEFNRDLKRQIEAYENNQRNPKNLHTLKAGTVDELFHKLMRMEPVNPKDPKCLSIRRMLEEFDAKKPIKKNLKVVLHMLDWLTLCFAALDLYIETSPEWFLPRRMIVRKTFNTPVRLFCDSVDKFAFVHEVLEVLTEREMEAETFKNMIQNSGQLRTMTFEQLREFIEEQMKIIEFVPMRIIRSKHRAVYIPSFNGRYCIRTVDFFLELLRYLISVKSLFYNMDEENWSKLVVMFTSIDDDIDLLTKTPAFIDVEEVDAIYAVFRDYIDTSFKDLIKDTKKIRPVGTKGFTYKDFKAEIQFLGLKNFFKNINDYDALVFSMISHKKEKDVLRTCDMYEALELIQLWCLLTKLPRHYTWLQMQGFCCKFPIMCFNCEPNDLLCRKKKPK